MTPENKIRIFRATRVAEGRARLVRFLDGVPQRVYSRQELLRLFHDHAPEWQLLSRVTPSNFIDYLQSELGMEQVVLLGETHSQKFTRYLWREPSVLEVAGSLRSTAYLSHASAVYVHGLSDQIPRTLYVNYEQSPKPRPSGGLTQAGIDRAFRGKQRESTFAFDYRDYQFILLSGKNSRNLEVSRVPLPEGGSVRVTSLERTLIDITVRPNYSGGVFQVLDAYRGARDQVSVGRLVATLKKLDYIYPYHQAIGFFMERAGFEARQLSRLREIGMEYDFFLAHQLQDLQYDRSWRIHYPAGL